METPRFPSGRKIFYFFPKGPYHQQVVKKIIHNEFEIYTLSEYKRGLPLIFQYNGAIILFHVDAIPEFEHIAAVIRDFCGQSSHRSIELFLLTHSQERSEEIEEYMKRLDNCRSLLLDKDPGTESEALITLLNDLQARGQRRYVRFGSNGEEIAAIELSHKGKKARGVVHDISTAGLSFSMPEGPALSIRSKLKDLYVDFDEGIDELSGTISIKRKLPSGAVLYVLMFDKTIRQDVAEKLRVGIHHELQRQFTKRLESVAVPEE